jgi:hypothetical protein
MKTIFLSASVPLPDRNPRFRETVDVVAIRDAVRALAIACAPDALLVFGGHPSITPLLRQQMQQSEVNVPDHFTIYQSRYFEPVFIEDVRAFESIVYTDVIDGNLQTSLRHMRDRMLGENSFDYGFFIGGMEGILDENNLFVDRWPRAKAYPIASTGAAARVLFEEYPGRWNSELMDDMRYLSLFRRLINSTQGEQNGTESLL